jgi:hypothetical protein
MYKWIPLILVGFSPENGVLNLIEVMLSLSFIAFQNLDLKTRVKFREILKAGSYSNFSRGLVPSVPIGFKCAEGLQGKTKEKTAITDCLRAQNSTLRDHVQPSSYFTHLSNGSFYGIGDRKS